MEVIMFCYQCEQTAKGSGCSTLGVCGKSGDVAALQDLLVFSLKHLAAATLETQDQHIDEFICEGLFSTITNVNFDEDSIAILLRKSEKLRCQSDNNNASGFVLAETIEGMIKQAVMCNVDHRLKSSPDIYSLQNTTLYGLKGIASYANHAYLLGESSAEIYLFIKKTLANMLREDLSLDDWLNLALECGKINFETMKLLDYAHNKNYGTPAPTKVPLGVKAGKAILVSGHDLKDLDLLLQQTTDKNINVYTHGEMLPTHGYPKLKKYPHFHGHYGTAWQNQHKEFRDFPGSILMTTNCIQSPSESYKNNIFTTGLVEWPSIHHVGADKDFSPVIKRALELPGFTESSDNGSVMAGFGHHTVLSIADKIIKAVQEGKIRHFFLVAGCDGAKLGRNYYTELVEKIPEDCIVLTLACGKFRFFDKQLGNIEGIPRLIDLGQCNDAYSAIKIVVALSQAFNVGVNDLPLSLILSWYEQKAVAVLLTLLHLGIKNIRLGPSLPAFLSNNVLQKLVEQFNIMPITTPEKDLKAILEPENIK
jgi:hydroxylamine reductase